MARKTHGADELPLQSLPTMAMFNVAATGGVCWSKPSTLSRGASQLTKRENPSHGSGREAGDRTVRRTDAIMVNVDHKCRS
jgi:hypothetical protein